MAKNIFKIRTLFLFLFLSSNIMLFSQKSTKSDVARKADLQQISTSTRVAEKVQETEEDYNISFIYYFILSILLK